MKDKKPCMKGSKALSVMVAMMFAASAVAIIFSAATANDNDLDKTFTGGFLGAGGDVKGTINFGGDGNDVFYDVIMVPDGFVAVGYSGWESFDGGEGDDWIQIKGYGGKDAIIVKYGPDWNVIWAVHFGGPGNDEFYGVAVMEHDDKSYTLFAVGYSDATSFFNEENVYEMDVNYGYWVEKEIEGYGGKDAIIVAFDGINGSPIDAMHFGGIDEDVFYGVAVHGEDIFAVGSAHTDSFGTGSWEDVHPDQDDPVGYGGLDAIIVGFNNHEIIGALNFGGAGDDVFYGVAASENGVFAVGYSEFESFSKDSWDSSTWALSVNDPVDPVGYGKKDAIIALYAEGELIFALNFGGAGDDVFYGVAVSSEGDVFAVGYSDDDSFGTGSWVGDWLDEWINDPEDAPEGYGGLDAIIVAFRDYGVFKAINIGGVGDDVFYGVAVSSEGDVFAVGYSDEDSFGEDTGKGKNDAVAALFRDAELLEIMNFGGVGDDVFYGIAITESPNYGYELYAVGYSDEYSFESGDWPDGILGKGGDDAIVMIIDGGELPETGNGGDGGDGGDGGTDDDNLMLYLAIGIVLAMAVIGAVYFLLLRR